MDSSVLGATDGLEFNRMGPPAKFNANDVDVASASRHTTSTCRACMQSTMILCVSIRIDIFTSIRADWVVGSACCEPCALSLLQFVSKWKKCGLMDSRDSGVMVWCVVLARLACVIKGYVQTALIAPPCRHAAATHFSQRGETVSGARKMRARRLRECIAMTLPFSKKQNS
jgi:hypothetical protein